MASRRPTLADALRMSGRSQDADETFGVDVGPVDRDRCGVLVRISPEKRRQLKMTAIVRNTTVQQLLTEAIEIVLQSSDPGHAH